MTKRTHRRLAGAVAAIVAFASLVCGQDRFTNDAEVAMGTHSFTAIFHHPIVVTSQQQYVIETTNLSSGGDTYMYLWDWDHNRQIAKDDDGGSGVASRIVVTLNPGIYVIYVRAFSVYDQGTCDLYVNGQFATNGWFGGTMVVLYNQGISPETQFRAAAGPGEDTYLLLTNTNWDLVAINDDAEGYGLGSALVAADPPGYLIIGAYLPSSQGQSELTRVTDANLEFLTFYGEETRHRESGAKFASNMYQTNLAGTNVTLPLAVGDFSHTTTPNSLDMGADAVDLIWDHSHGSIGNISANNGTLIDITSANNSCGGGHRTAGDNGDLEYAAFLSCQTVRIEHYQSWAWLVDRGWKSQIVGTDTIKGFFDGVHVVVGYHSNHHNYDHRIYGKSWELEGQTFARKIRGATKAVWTAWYETNDYVYEEFSNIFVDRSPGMASSIAITDQWTEPIGSHASPDIKIGNWDYLFTVHWFGHEGDDVPVP